MLDHAGLPPTELPLANLSFADLVTATERATPDCATPDCATPDPTSQAASIPLYAAWIAANPASPHLFAAWFNLGAALAHTGRTTEAITAYRNAAALRPGFHPASLNLGLALEQSGQTEDALAAWATALQPTAERTALLNQQARLLERLGRLDEAETLLRTSLLTDPAQPDAIQHWVHIRQKACAWPVLTPLPGLDGAALHRHAGPLAVLALSDDIATQTEAAALWIARKTTPAPHHLAPAGGYDHPRIRLGYLSSDFCRHAMSYLVAELFERHDRTRFEVFGYCTSPEDGSPLRARILAAFDHVRIIRQQDDRAAAQLIRDDEIDVLIDLNGLTAGARPQLLRWKPAPLQATYLGFVGPVPLPELDHLLCDDVVIPPGTPYHPAPLPIGPLYQANDTRRPTAPTPPRAELGLPEQAFVLCCFSNHYKITEALFASWMRILHAAPAAVLWLAADTACSRRNLEASAAAAGIVPHRLVFADRCDPETYMGRLAAADLFLDTFPYNAGTVASDALRRGLPLITLGGQAFASRMATSLLHHLGAPGLATTSLARYEAEAIRLATDPAHYAAAKARFTTEAWSRTLGDAAAFTRTFEAAIAAAHARRRLPPSATTPAGRAATPPPTLPP